MFKKNKAHQQPALISAVHDLPQKQRERLEQSWAGTFYREFFCRIDEESFAVLYSQSPSRPNIAVNVLVGLEVIKAGFGWSDEELYEAFLYNLQVRYALGYDRLGDGEFELRTLYNFRRRLSEYNLQRGVNLLEQAFEGITDKQIVELKVGTNWQRMDSTQIASNILDASRLQLVVEGIQRLQRLLGESERAQREQWLSPYLGESSGHYAYRVKGQEATQKHLQKAGQVLYRLLSEMQAGYEKQAAYQVVKRLLEENFQVSQEAVQPKDNKQLTTRSLQSLDDEQASYRVKGNQHYKGYVANLAETCDPDNGVQLITKVQVAPNNQSDADLLTQALPNLKERTHLETLHTDGAYPSETNDEQLREHNVHLIQSGIRGNRPDPEHFGLADFQIQFDEKDQPVCLTCPQGQSALLTRGKTSGWFARFPAQVCAACPFQQDQRCRSRPQKKDPRYFLDFTLQEARVARRRQDCLAQRKTGRNPRAAVEATVRSLKHPFPAGKLPVRGRFRMGSLILASAFMVNIRRIHAYQAHLQAQATSQLAQPLFCRLFPRYIPALRLAFS